MNDSTIVAPATPIGKGAIGIIRISGKDAIKIADKIFTPIKRDSKTRKLKSAEPYRLLFGRIEQEDGSTLDELLVAIFKAPHSYTGEDSVEFYTHSSSYIMNGVLQMLINNGAKMALAGEFTQRAFLNGKMDLAQAEAVADLIASENKAAHDVAMNQVKGIFSNELRKMRGELIELLSLIELELDFSEEDVEFASREKIEELIYAMHNKISKLAGSFSMGNVIRNGIPVAIVGAVNTGKSTLLNLLLGDERAIVSDIQGTTRDSIEDVVNIEGNLFRFIDTAGIRKTSEKIELIGIENTYKKIAQSSIIILMLDYNDKPQIDKSIKNLSERYDAKRQSVLVVVNKVDEPESQIETLEGYINECCNQRGIKPINIIFTSLKYGDSPTLPILKELSQYANEFLKWNENSIMVTNTRHYQALTEAKASLEVAMQGLRDNIAPDLLAQDLHQAISDLASITGEISSQDVLTNIFQNFCVGK